MRFRWWSIRAQASWYADFESPAEDVIGVSFRHAEPDWPGEPFSARLCYR